MEYVVTDEQKMIADSIDRMLAHDYDFQKRCQWLKQGQHFQPSIWQKYAELGLLAMPLPEAYGGFNAGLRDMAVVVSALGRALVVEPFIACYLGARYVAMQGSDAQKKALLPEIASGSRRVVLAMPLACHRAFLSTQGQLQAEQIDSGQWQLNGCIDGVIGAEYATEIIVFAKIKGQDKTLACMLNQAALAAKHYTMIDDVSVSQCMLNNTIVEADASWQVDDAVLESLRMEAVSLLCAEAVAIMQVMNQKTKTYLQNREQFGRPLSQFQLLQHRLVEMYVQEELARSMSATLAMAIDDKEHAHDRENLADYAKLKINDYAQYVGEQSVQLHGGMGVSDEMDIAHYFRRLTCIRHLFGDQVYCLATLVDRQTKDKSVNTK